MAVNIRGIVTSELQPWWRKIGVEPVMFLYMSAYMITSVVEEAFFVYKVCHVNLGLPKNICDTINLEENKDYKTEVQIKVSTFHQYENIASNAIPIILAFFLGAWSDKIGRKIPLLLGLIGNFLYASMIVVNALQESWPVEMVLWTACLPCALTGGNLTVFMAAFSYLADTTTQEDRTLRTTFLEVAYLIPMPTGVALGSYLFYHVLNKSYAGMFLINASLQFTAIIYTMLVLKRYTGKPTMIGSNSRLSCWNLWGLIDLRHVAASIKTLVKPRLEKRRLYLILVLVGMALYTFQRDEKPMMYLYTQLKFHWDVATFSNFRTFQSSIFVIGLLVGVPILLKVLKLRDTYTIMVGAVSHIGARIIFAVAQTEWLLYLGSVVALFGPAVAPVFRSVTSKLVPPSERGKVFAIFSVADSSVPLVSGVVYSQIYNHTISTFPQSIFVVTGVSQLVVFVIAMYIHSSRKGNAIDQAQDETEDTIESS